MTAYQRLIFIIGAIIIKISNSLILFFSNAALNLKQIPFEYKTIDLLARIKNPVPTDLDEKNPMGQVPVLEVVENDKITYLSQSLPIIEFIEESYPGI